MTKPSFRSAFGLSLVLVGPALGGCSKPAPSGPVMADPQAVRKGFDLLRSAGKDAAKLAEPTHLFAEQVKRSPYDPDALFGLGWSDQLAGRVIDAEIHYRKAAALAEGEPKYQESEFYANHNLGYLFIESGRAEEALGPLRRAVALRGSSASAWAGYGRALMALGAFTKAMPAMEKAVSLLPNDASVRRDYGVILYSRGKYAEARTEFTAALKADPSLAKSIEPFLAAIPAAGAAPGANPAMPATPEGDVAVPPTAAKN